MNLCADIAAMNLEDAMEDIADQAARKERERCLRIARYYMLDTMSLMSMPPKSAAACAIIRDIEAGVDPENPQQT